jgi:hypothetical protein
MVAANRKGADEIDSWVKPLAKRFSSKIQISGIADMSPVPAVLRPLVRKRFAQDRQYPVMLDWRGDVVREFLLDPRHANVVLLSTNGQVIWQSAGKATPGDLEALFRAIDLALQDARSKTQVPKRNR